MVSFIEWFKTSPKFQLIILLAIFYIVAMFHLPFFQSFYLLFFCLIFTVGSDLIFKALNKRSFQIPFSAIITSLILTLTIDPSASILQILVICLSAMAIKNFLRFGKHIFNPAASGLLIGWLVFGLYPSWWAVSLYTVKEITLSNLFITASVLSFGLVSGYKLKRYLTITSYLLALGILSYIFSLSTNLVSLVNLISSPGTLFFALVMLPEPMTSPFKKSWQILFGLSVALTQILIVAGLREGVIPFDNFPDMSLLALLIANLGYFIASKLVDRA